MPSGWWWWLMMVVGVLVIIQRGAVAWPLPCRWRWLGYRWKRWHSTLLSNPATLFRVSHGKENEDWVQQWFPPADQWSHIWSGWRSYPFLCTGGHVCILRSNTRWPGTVKAEEKGVWRTGVTRFQEEMIGLIKLKNCPVWIKLVWFRFSPVEKLDQWEIILTGPLGRTV